MVVEAVFAEGVVKGLLGFGEGGGLWVGFGFPIVVVGDACVGKLIGLMSSLIFDI